MRVIHINEHLSWTGGVEVYLLHLLPLLEQQGVECLYWYARGEKELVPRARPLAQIGQTGPVAERQGYLLAKQWLEEVKPDVIHIHRVYNIGVIRACLDYGPTLATCHDYTYVCPAGSFYFRRTRTICNRKAGPGCFFITFFRHCLTPRPRYAWSYYRRVRKFAAWRHRFAAILCPSDSVRDRLLEQGFPSQSTHTLPYFCPVTPRSEPRPLPCRPTISFLGRIRPVKGYDVFIQTLARLPGVLGVLIGDGDPATRKRVFSMAEKHGCQDRLELRPWADRQDIPRVFAETTVFMFPSLWPETLGIVGLEAMAHGVPVVASDVGGVRQWLRNGENGLLVPPKDVEAAVHAVRTLLESPELLDRMGRCGIETVCQHFNPRNHIEKLLSIYSKVSRSQ